MNTTGVTPLFDRVLCRRDPPRMKSGAIILQGGVAALERRSKDGNPATVLAVGPGGDCAFMIDGKWKYVRVEMTLKPGDRVLLGFHPGPDAGLPDHCLPRESDIKGLITEE